MKKIKYCCKNMKLGSKAVYKLLKLEYPDIKQAKKDCLGNCKLCSKECFVMIGKKEVICGASPEILYGQIKKLIS